MTDPASEALWEIGSEFDWREEFIGSSGDGSSLPGGCELYSTGRSVLLSLGGLYAAGGRRPRILLPSFFCMEVAASLKKVFDLVWYRDLPAEAAPDFDSLNPLPGDLVLAVNFFGIRNGGAWKDWLNHHNEVVLIEDHTHDPFSLWSQQSTAQYAFSSLRKTLPIPDGAILWSPRKLPLPEPSAPPPIGAYQKLASMVLKRAYLCGANISKDAYRTLQIKGEQSLALETDSAASSFTCAILGCLDALKMRNRREANVRQFFQLVTAESNSDCVPLFTTWPEGTVPYNSILVCKNSEIRDKLLKFLINRNIYATIHWRQEHAEVSSGDKAAIDLSRRILTIPTDHRYSPADIEKVGKTISAFT